MSAAMKGAANPAQMIKAILEGASQAIAGLVKAGIGGAAEVARSVMSAASNAIMSIVSIVVDIVKAVLAGRKPHRRHLSPRHWRLRSVPCPLGLPKDRAARSLEALRGRAVDRGRRPHPTTPRAHPR